MDVKVDWKGGLCFAGSGGSGHEVVMDASRATGGENRGASPMELLLHGVAGCSGIDIVKILEKKRAEIEDIEISIEGIRADDHPRKFEKLKLHFEVTGRDMSRKDVEQAVNLSVDKYCSASNSLTAEKEVSFELNRTD